jgi:6-phosphofructokinase 1
MTESSLPRVRRIAINTGGGDAPGLNGIIESACRVLLQNGVDVVGIRDGFEGVFGNKTIPLTMDIVRNAHANSGTLLGSSNRTGTAGREAEFTEKFRSLELDGLIACGGDGTFSGLAKVIGGINLIGVPKTIDNDLAGTEATFGFDTACACVAENVDGRHFGPADRLVRMVMVVNDSMVVPEKLLDAEKNYHS